jgi:hypothetical protein
MNISIQDAFNKVVVEHKIDLNTIYHLEATFCVTKMFDLFDLKGMNPYQVKNFIELVERLVFPKFPNLPTTFTKK